MNKAQQVVAEIKRHLAIAGNVVQLITRTRGVVYSSPEDFKATTGGAYVRRGKSWDCFATPSMVLVGVRFGRKV